MLENLSRRASYAAETTDSMHVCMLLRTLKNVPNRARLLVLTHITRWTTQPGLSHGLPTSLNQPRPARNSSLLETRRALVFEGFSHLGIWAWVQGRCSGHRMGNMNDTMAWAWMLWSSCGVEHECYYGLGMDALAIVWGRTEHESYYGLGTDALVIVWGRT